MRPPFVSARGAVAITAEYRENRPMAAKREVPRAPAPKYILVIDVGGTHVKLRLGEQRAVAEFESGLSMTPGRMARRVCKLLDGQRYDAVSIGYPGLV